MEENSKKSNNMGVGIVIGILITLVICLGGYLIYNEFIKKDDNGTDNNKPVTTPEPSSKPVQTGKVDLDINDSDVKKLVEIFIPLGEDMSILDGFKTTLLNESNEYRLITAYQNLDKSLIKKTTCANYDLEVDNCPCGSQGYTGEDPSTITIEKKKSTETLVVKGSDLKAKYKELFGTNYEYKAENFSLSLCGITFFNYSKDKDVYVAYSSGSGCVAYQGANIFKSAYKENDKLVIETEYKDEMSEVTKKLTYEFKLENGNYTFVKVVEE